MKALIRMLDQILRILARFIKIPAKQVQLGTLAEILTPRNIISFFRENSFVFFDTPEQKLNLNLVGVRRDSKGTNEFDDYLIVLYRDGKEMVQSSYPITTDPGKHWLEHPINPRGTAVLVPGQYRGGWKLGKHQNNYEALVQRKACKVWRDNNKDEIIDYEGMEAADKGFFGINIHRSNPYSESFLVNKWSAGCQVFKRVEDYNEFLGLCKKSAVIYGNSFTYTLITEQDLRNHLNN